VLLFAKLPHVFFTNNRAERDLRMSKVNLKSAVALLPDRTSQHVEPRLFPP
jgi:hypothetical protein